MVTDNTKILFLCSGNSCRSQMAEGFLRHHLKALGLPSAAAAVRSAGVRPQGLNPLTVKSMEERGIDISEHQSESLEKYSKSEFDYIITVCDHAAQNCPTFPGAGTRLHWPFDDPASAAGTLEEKLLEFHRIRDQIEQRVKTWLGF